MFFLPHIGRHYLYSPLFGKRILVLGESHYCDRGCIDCGAARHGDCARFTQKVIADYLNPANEREGWMNTYLKFERSLVGHETENGESRRIWDSVAFYNYLQVAMGGPREAGQQDQYQNAATAFIEALETLRPDLVIVWGMRLWNALPSGEMWCGGTKVVVEGYEVQNGFYRLNDGLKVRAFAVYHPSAGYDWAFWHKVIVRFLDEV